MGPGVPGLAKTAFGTTPLCLHLGRWDLPGGGDRAREDGALACPRGPGRRGEGTDSHGAGLPGEHGELGRGTPGPAGPRTVLAPPLLAVGDGALGLWAALDQVFPNTEHQRCWNHRVLNVRSKLPKRLQAEVRGRLREMTESETQALCEERRDAYVAELRSEGQGAAAETVLRDWEDFATFYLSQRTLGAPANQQPHRVHLQRGKTADRRGQAYTLPGECPLPGVQDGGAPQRKLADVERRREPDGPGLGGT